ncbi:MAG: hypothetical protein ACRC1K_13990, partial [Planctomycetia bacterium]
MTLRISTAATVLWCIAAAWAPVESRAGATVATFQKVDLEKKTVEIRLGAGTKGKVVTFPLADNVVLTVKGKKIDWKVLEANDKLFVTTTVKDGKQYVSKIQWRAPEPQPPAPKPDAYEAGQSLTNKGEDDFVNAWNKMGYGYFPGPQPTTSARL